MITIRRARKRVITLLLVAACSILLTPSLSEVGLPHFLLWFATFMMLFGSQIFWIDRILDIAERFIPGKPRRIWLGVMAAVLYVCFFFAYNFAPLKMLFTGHVIHTPGSKFYRTLIDGIFSVWLVGSFIGFVFVVFFWTADQVVRGANWIYRRFRETVGSAADFETDAIALRSRGRRQLIRQIAIAVSAIPFGAAAYGLLHERLNVEVTRRRIALKRLPKLFDGFRIAQLSDVHISSFMSADEIRRCVALTNQLKPDLVVLTGDYLSWDPAAQQEVVSALAGLRAPYGIFGCLGNHETITRTEASIPPMFAAKGIRILRQERALIRKGEETLNIIGVDDSLEDFRVIQPLVMPETVNILLCHWPPSFDAAVKLGIDLTVAGHTHGGQLSLEFLRRGLCLSRLETQYVSGWYEKSGHQLYVNRGIGTTMIPIRLGARPEITVLELVRSI
jgi:predicted MPP superfamily phosphohydrolase